MTAFVDVHGLRIAYQREGSGRPIVFLHGFFGDHRVWRRQFELAGEYTCIAWDAPGCGGSTIPSGSFAMNDYADVLAGFIKRVDLDEPHIVGNSFGGTLALQLASRHPATAKSVVGMDTYAGWSGSFSAAVVSERLAASLPDLELAPDQVAAKWLTGFLTPEAPERMKDEVSDIITDFKPAGMSTMIRSLAEADLREDLKSIHLPTLLIWGAQDVRSPLTVAQDLAARLEGSRFVVVEGAGHLVNVEAGDRVNSELRAFFRSVDSRN